VLTRGNAPPPATVQVYALTPWGREAEPIVMALGRWALRSPAHDPSLPFSPVSLMLALRIMLLPERTQGFDATIGFRMGTDTYGARVANGMVLIERGTLDHADAMLSGKPNAFLPALFGTTPLPEVVAQGRLAVSGDVALAARFCTFFELPPKIGCN